MTSLHRILAIETSSRCGSIALLESDQIVAERQLPAARRTTQCLVPSIGDLANSAGWTIHEIQMVAVSQGPGSFTGIRVGLTTAITFAYAIKAKIVAVNTLDCIAAQAPKDVSRLAVVIDAQRGELCAATYQRQTDGVLERMRSWEIVTRRDWLEHLPAEAAVIGPGLAKLRDDLVDRVDVIAQPYWDPRAATVGQLGWSKYQHGQCDDLWTLKPIYFRQSAAEERIAAR